MTQTKDAAESAVATGLRGVVAAASSISDVNGEKGELIYQGLNIHDLATKSTFEEVVFLLWNGRLPKRAELDELRKNLAASYEIPDWVRGPIEYFPKDAEPMDTLLAFYRKVHPWTAGWAAVAKKAPEIPPTRDMAYNLLDWIAGCVMIYGSLFGVGKLLLKEYAIGLVFLAVGLAAGAVIYRDLPRRGWSSVLE